MKKFNIFVIASCVTAIASGNIFAQSIELPDVTTVIQGENVKVENSALPEFSDVLKDINGSGTIEPQLPDVNNSVTPTITVKNNKNKEKTIFSEVSVGGGYPFLFYGNCKVSNTDRLSPFNLAFSYDAANGYEGNELTDNFSDSKINLFVNKSFNINNLLLDFSTSYDLKSNGFQNQISGMSELNNVLVTGKGNIEYDFKNGFSLGANVGLDFYNRYASISDKDVVKDFDSWIKKSSLITFVPEAYVQWAGNGFNFYFNGEYLLDGVLFNSLADGNIHRGIFSTGLDWQNEIVNIFGKVGLVFGNQLKNNSVLVPFSLGFDVLFPVYFSNRRVGILGEGGLETRYNTVAELENSYDFAGLSQTTFETADWYGKIKIDIPLKTSFTANIGAEYRHTAFNNGWWEPEYNNVGFNNGLYGFKQNNKQILSTDLALTFHYKLFSVKAGWFANWFDVPVNESMQMFKLNMAFQDTESRWGASLFGTYNVDKNWQLPVIGLDGFVQISPTIRLNAVVEDVISLFDSGARINAGKYIDRGCTASVFINFVL